MRVTLDWDDADAKEGNIERARRAVDGKPYELRRSSSGNGWHFIGYEAADDTSGGFENMMRLRDTFGDDPKRLRLDRKRWNAGSPFMQVLYRRKYMDRFEWPDAEKGYQTGHEARVVEQSDWKAAPSRERIKDPDTGRLDYPKISRLLANLRYGTQAELARKMDVSTSTVSRWVNNPDAGISEENRKELRRKARSQGIGHYKQTPDGGQAADRVKYVDPDETRRTLVEYIDVPWDTNIGDEDREYALLNTHTGSYNAAHGNRQLRHIHDDVTEHAMERLSPSMNGTSLDLDERNENFHGVSGWTREADSINYEREILDEGEADVYLDNLPEKPSKAYNPQDQPLFEVILWDDDMTELLWHVIGVWAGESVSDAVILRDNQGWW